MIVKDTEIVAQNLINEILDNLETLDSCGKASDVIDNYSEQWPDSEMTQDFRERLCDKTFEVYYEEYGKE
jgi:hypothetical protein